MNTNLNNQCIIGSRTAPNRFLAQPIELNNAQRNGCFSESMLNHYRKKAKGRWGVTVIETTATSDYERCRQNGLILVNSDENEQSWKNFFSEMKSLHEDGLWIVEISAAGFKNQSGPAQSLFKGQHEMPGGRIMSEQYIDQILNDYIHATRLAYERGADGIDIKLCHAYLAGIFLRPNNLRMDKYGGSFDNRTYFLREFTRRAKKEIGDSNFLWTSRLNAWDGSIPGGFGMAGPKPQLVLKSSPNENDRNITDDKYQIEKPRYSAWVRDVEEVEMLYSLLNDLGYDLINVSAGVGVPVGMVDINHSIHPNFIFLQNAALHAKEFFKSIGSTIKIASTGWSALGPLSIPIGSEYIDRGIDFIGYGREQLCEPQFPKKILEYSKNCATYSEIIQLIEDNINICLVCGKCYDGLHGKGPVDCPIYWKKNK